MMMNIKTPALSTKEARQALAFAINRDTQVQQAMGGLGRPGYGAFGDGFKWLLNEDASYPKKYPLDVEKAKALLQQAGWPPTRRCGWSTTPPARIKCPAPRSSATTCARSA